MATHDVITPYTALDELLTELIGHWRRILGENLAGAYVQGSFALGSGDRHSDCDWLVATHGSLTEQQIAQLRDLHDEVPTRDGHWCHNIEGSSHRLLNSLRSTTSAGTGCSTTTATAP